mgnify:CR=1 FL=1
MSIRSKLKIENVGMFTAFLFYAIVGITWFVVLPMANFPPHIGILAILSLIAAYGLFRKRSWTIWVVVVLFFVVTTSSVVTLYYLLGKDLLIDVSMIAYLILTWVFTAYAVDKRKTLES